MHGLGAEIILTANLFTWTCKIATALTLTDMTLTAKYTAWRWITAISHIKYYAASDQIRNPHWATWVFDHCVSVKFRALVARIIQAYPLSLVLLIPRINSILFSWWSYIIISTSIIMSNLPSPIIYLLRVLCRNDHSPTDHGWERMSSIMMTSSPLLLAFYLWVGVILSVGPSVGQQDDPFIVDAGILGPIRGSGGLTIEENGERRSYKQFRGIPYANVTQRFTVSSKWNVLTVHFQIAKFKKRKKNVNLQYL